MPSSPQFALNAAAWFFVGKTTSIGAPQYVPIKSPFRIGRDPESDLCLSCRSVSGNHAEITQVDGEFWLTDLGSTNGTYVNGDRIAEAIRLHPDDTIQFGTTVFQISDQSSRQSEAVPRYDADVTELERLQNDRFERLFSDGVVPFFQPIVQINTDQQQLVGYEVLGRSRLFGLRTPAEMFATASRLEMEAELSRTLRQQGVRVADESFSPEQYLYVNTHPAELECSGLIDSLTEIRESHPGRPLMLETHIGALSDHMRFQGFREKLRELDIQLAFHDFGNGETRLSQLCDIGPDVIKFNVELVQNIRQAPEKRQKFVASLVQLVREMGIRPLAECIECSEDHEFMKQLGFELAQGFLYGHPCNVVDCLKLANDPAAANPLESPGSTAGQFRSSGTTNQSVAPSTGNGPRDADWVLSLPEHKFTIQVLSATSEERARSHVEKQDHPEQFAVFEKSGRSRPLYIVVHGVFGDREEARQASARLDDATISPWIRVLSSVQAEIKSPQPEPSQD